MRSPHRLYGGAVDDGSTRGAPAAHSSARSGGILRTIFRKPGTSACANACGE